MNEAIEDIVNDAIKAGNLSEVKQLCEISVDVDFGKLFRLACSHGQLEVTKYFVGKGVDIHSSKDAGFAWACINEHFEVVEYLITLDNHILDDGEVEQWLFTDKKVKILEIFKKVKRKTKLELLLR